MDDQEEIARTLLEAVLTMLNTIETTSLGYADRVAQTTFMMTIKIAFQFAIVLH